VKLAGAIVASPAAVQGRVVVGSREGELLCAEQQSGAVLWRWRGGGMEASPVISGRRVVVATKDGRLTLVDLATGKTTWQFDVGSPISATPAVGGGWVVVVAEDGRVWAFSGPTLRGERSRVARA
jgi:outer membrane protein assembly factor BamB